MEWYRSYIHFQKMQIYCFFSERGMRLWACNGSKYRRACIAYCHPPALAIGRFHNNAGADLININIPIPHMKPRLWLVVRSTNTIADPDIIISRNY